MRTAGRDGRLNGQCANCAGSCMPAERHGRQGCIKHIAAHSGSANLLVVFAHAQIGLLLPVCLARGFGNEGSLRLF